MISAMRRKKRRLEDLILCRSFRRGILLVFIVLINATSSFSQNFCTQTLKQAQEAFDEGRISAVPGILEQCLKNGFNKEEKATAYRLLALTYVYLDEPVKADEAMLMLLKFKPEYKINPSVDPSEFINLYNGFRTDPIYRLGVKGGANFMIIDLVKMNSTNGDIAEEIRIKSNVGFQLGVASEIPWKNNLEICPELLFTTKELKFDYESAGQRSNYKERVNQVSLPVLLKYSIGKKNYIPTVNAGIEVNYLISAIGSTGGHNVSPSTEVTSYRRALGYALVIGSGVKSKFGPGVISAGIRFFYSLRTSTDKKESYSDNAAYVLSYGMANSLYKMNTFNFNVSYLIPIYKPKRIK